MMRPEIEEGPTDAPPSTGVFVDWEGAQHDPATVAEGDRLGQTIDIDDDTDNGLEPGEQPGDRHADGKPF